MPGQASAALILLVIACGTAALLTVGCEDPAQRFDYAVVSVPDLLFDRAMDRAGEMGWEVVSARRAVGPGGGPEYEVIMKRRLRRGEQPTERLTVSDFISESER